MAHCGHWHWQSHCGKRACRGHAGDSGRISVTNDAQLREEHQNTYLMQLSCDEDKEWAPHWRPEQMAVRNSSAVGPPTVGDENHQLCAAVRVATGKRQCITYSYWHCVQPTLLKVCRRNSGELATFEEVRDRFSVLQRTSTRLAVAAEVCDARQQPARVTHLYAVWEILDSFASVAFQIHAARRALYGRKGCRVTQALARAADRDHNERPRSLPLSHQPEGCLTRRDHIDLHLQNGECGVGRQGFGAEQPSGPPASPPRWPPAAFQTSGAAREKTHSGW